MAKKRVLNDSILRLKFKNSLSEQIQRLLQRNYEPAVAIQPSRVRNADFGLHTTRSVLKGEALCLYPGVFSAGLPKGTQVPAFGEARTIFMGHLFPPSGVKHEDQNCYILDITPRFGVLEKVSGYIDALALSVSVVSPSKHDDDIYGSSLDDDTSPQKRSDNNAERKDEHNRIEQRRLDENPSACGHFMNHSPKPNTTLYTFSWEDMYPNYRPGLFDDENDKMYDLPNISRTDGGPRYITYIGSDMSFYPVDESKFEVKDVCGAVICAKEDINAGQELFRDYELEPPYPKWAIDWYVPSPDIYGPKPTPKPDMDNAEDNDNNDDGEEWRLT